MHTGVFDMFRDGVFHHFSVLCHGVELHFFRFLHELGHHYRVFFRHLTSHFQETGQLFLIVTYVHGRTGKHVRRTNQYRITHLVDESLHVVQAGQLLPSRLVDAETVEHGRELVAVLRTVDRHRRRAQDVYRLTMEFHGQVVRYLSTHGHDDTARLLQVDHVEHTLERQLIEVETVAHVIVRRNRLWIIVDHDGLVTQLACGLYRVDGAPIEFHRRTDTVSTGPQHDDRLVILVIIDIVAVRAVCHVKVVRQFRMFGCHRVDALHSR